MYYHTSFQRDIQPETLWSCEGHTFLCLYLHTGILSYFPNIIQSYFNIFLPNNWFLERSLAWNLVIPLEVMFSLFSLSRVLKKVPLILPIWNNQHVKQMEKKKTQKNGLCPPCYNSSQAAPGPFQIHMSAAKKD